MTLPEGYTFSAVTSADKAEIYTHDMMVFAGGHTLEAYLEVPVPFDYDRVVVVRDPAQRIAALHASYAFHELPTPGGQVRAAGLTWVGVHPQNRRQGLLRTMMEEHFRQCVERDEPVSVLTAAEPTIYGRFGYGVAAHDVRAKIGRSAALRPLRTATHEDSTSHDSQTPLTVRVETYAPAAHATTIEDLHRRAGRSVGATGLNRPGWVSRETEGLVAAHHSTIDLTPGREPQRIIIVEREGAPVGYARFRRAVSWQNTGPQGRVDAGEVVAVDPAASRRLWEVLTDLDLTSEISAFMIPVDDPIISLLENNRAVSMTHVDNVWARIIEVPKALAKRQYAGDLNVVLEVTDALLPDNAGRWHIRASAFGGDTGQEQPHIERTDAPVDIELDIRELSSVYLGGVSAASLAAAGLIHSTSPRTLAMFSTAFSWPVAPCSSWVF